LLLTLLVTFGMLFRDYGFAVCWFVLVAWDSACGLSITDGRAFGMSYGVFLRVGHDLVVLDFVMSGVPPFPFV